MDRTESGGEAAAVVDNAQMVPLIELGDEGEGAAGVC